MICQTIEHISEEDLYFSFSSKIIIKWNKNSIFANDMTFKI